MAKSLPSTKLLERLSRLGRPINCAAAAAFSSASTSTSSSSSAAAPPQNQETTSGDDDPFLNLDDVGGLFSSVSTPRLLRSALNLHAFAMGPMVDVGTWVMKSRLLEIPVLREATLGAVKHTAFQHFCAGQTPEEAGQTTRQLWERTGIRGILVYGLEHATDNEWCDRNLQGFLQTVESAKSDLPRSSVSFVVVKITAICPMDLLRRVGDQLRWQHRDPSLLLPWKRDTVIPIFADSSPVYHTQEAPHPLSAEEEHNLELGHQRLQKLYLSCCEAGVPLMVDAEDTVVQPAIDYLAYSSCLKDSRGVGVPILFNTIQTYLKDSRERLAIAQAAAEKKGVEVGFKLVRGAYMSSEGALAARVGAESPVHSSIEQTHACFDGCTRFMLERIAGGGGGGGAVVIATHNVESGMVAAKKSRELGIGRDDPRVQFAQLYGMADGLSLGLRNAGLQVSKYMVFGAVDLVIPFLLRRAEENRGLLSSSALDRRLIRKELKRRLITAL